MGSNLQTFKLAPSPALWLVRHAALYTLHVQAQPVRSESELTLFLGDTEVSLCHLHL